MSSRTTLGTAWEDGSSFSRSQVHEDYDRVVIVVVFIIVFIIVVVVVVVIVVIVVVILVSLIVVLVG